MHSQNIFEMFSMNERTGGTTKSDMKNRMKIVSSIDFLFSSSLFSISSIAISL